MSHEIDLEIPFEKGKPDNMMIFQTQLVVIRKWKRASSKWFLKGNLDTLSGFFEKCSYAFFRLCQENNSRALLMKTVYMNCTVFELLEVSNSSHDPF